MLRCKKHTFLELRDVLPIEKITGSLPNRDVSVLTLDSREVIPDSIFFAVSGEKLDGSIFIESAFSSGAAVVVSSKEAPVPDGKCLIIVDDVRAAIADVAIGFSIELLRELTIVGVTGTNGKTTTAHMINSILQAAHRKSAFIGTTGVTLPDGTIRKVTNTTPDIIELLSIFQELYGHGIDNFVIEVSSQGVVQNRVRGIPFRVGVFTNLTPEHMETHGSFEAYRQAKLKFFRDAAPAAAKIGKVFIGVVNGESPYFKDFEEACPGPPFIYGFEPKCDVRASGIVSSLFSVKFNLLSSACRGKVSVPIPGRHNVFNALAAASAGMALALTPTSIMKGLESLDVVSGRMERISSTERNIFIDYAHTSDALKQLLLSGREIAGQSGGKLVLVFGCGGDRDNTKRSRMGKIANDLADRVFITSDNPRTEDPHSIIQDILSGVESEKAQVVVEADRGLAIKRAVVESSKRDIVIIAGKGHEDYQILGSKRIHFDDSQEAEKAVSCLLSITIEELVKVTKAQTPFGIVPVVLTGVAIDSRKVTKGSIFVGLPGCNVHGQIYAEKAFTLGAAVVIVEDLSQAGCDGKANLLVVPSAEKAMQAAAAFVRQKLPSSVPVVGVTGSNGKTTTKEVIATVLSQLINKVHVSRGNFNNHLGLPVSLLSMPLEVDAAVFELGMSNPGEIDFLGNILKPSIGIITNVGSAHLETMGTVENVAKAKAEIIAHLPEDGLLLLNKNCPWSEFLQSCHKGRTGTVSVDYVGENTASGGLVEMSARFVSAIVSYDFIEGDLYLQWGDEKVSAQSVKIPVSGLHLVQAYLFAVLVALELKVISIDGINSSADSLSKILIEADVSGRMEKSVINGIRVINDGYNANPSSVAAAIKYISSLPSKGKVVLGEMLELGEIRDSAHHEIAVMAVELLGKERVFLLGDVFGDIAKKLDICLCLSIEEMALVLKGNLEEGDTLLLKASRGVAIERIIGLVFGSSGEQKLTN